tara:strand:- start:227 stop:847 length:621 start_codon:yes stop_codon:yes gene_type:complete
MTTGKDSRSADWDWNDYFDNITDPAMRPTVAHALKVLGAGQGRNAVDLGSGHGNDTRHILENGFNVLAIDGSEEGLKRLQSRFPEASESLTVRHTSFKNARWGANNWTNAGFALPFCSPQDFATVWERVKSGIITGGLFSGQLFGVRDSWNGRVTDMSFHTDAQVSGLIGDWRVHFHNIEETEGQDAMGRPKHWHIHHIVIEKPFP